MFTRMNYLKNTRYDSPLSIYFARLFCEISEKTFLRHPELILRSVISLIMIDTDIMKKLTKKLCVLSLNII
jgi:hypothetical protein